MLDAALFKSKNLTTSYYIKLIYNLGEISKKKMKIHFTVKFKKFPNKEGSDS